MILRVTCLPFSSERDGGMSLVLRTAEYSDILRRVGNRCGLHLDAVRILEHEEGKRDV